VFAFKPKNVGGWHSAPCSDEELTMLPMQSAHCCSTLDSDWLCWSQHLQRSWRHVAKASELSITSRQCRANTEKQLEKFWSLRPNAKFCITLKSEKTHQADIPIKIPTKINWCVSTSNTFVSQTRNIRCRTVGMATHEEYDILNRHVVFIFKKQKTKQWRRTWPL